MAQNFQNDPFDFQGLIAGGGDQPQGGLQGVALGGNDDLLSVLLQENLPGTGMFALDEATGDMALMAPEDDYMPANPPNGHQTNLAADVPPAELARIADTLLNAIDDDIESRSPWVERFRRGFEAMGLTQDEIDDGPFPGASTAVMPIISEAVVQFWARALAEQVPATGPAKGTVLGKSNQQLLGRAKRVADFQNHDIMNLDRSWYADHSRMLFALPYTGSCFKKTTRDHELGRNSGIYVQAEDFICNYAFTDLESAPRYSHRIWRTRNQLRKLQVAGVYLDVSLSDAPVEDLSEESKIKIDATDFDSGAQGRIGDNRHELFETYTDLDLAGFEDRDETGQPTGVALPYVVTIDKHTQKVLAIYRNWKADDPLKRAQTCFTKYDYIPGPGFYGLGLFHMIGGLQQAATGALRAIIDGSATASLQGGFMSKDASIKDQNLTLEPGIWKQVDATAEDLNKAFFTPPFKEPSPVLFQVMGLLVQRAEKFAATTEMQTGTENAKNMPVGSTVAMLEAGSKVFSTIHKGLHKSLQEELRQRYNLIQAYMPAEGYPYDVEGNHEGIMAEDFAPGVTVIPVSDPNIFSQTQRVALNQAIYELATQNPDIIERRTAVRRVLEGLNAPDIDDLMIAAEPPPPMDPVSEIQSLLRGEPVQAYPDQVHQAYLQHYWAFMNNPQFGGNPQVQQQIGPAAIALLGQRLAYAWAEHVRAMGVPAQMLPPPMQPEQGAPPVPNQPQQGLPQEQQVGPEQIAQMAAQIAPQLVSVPGLPNPQAQSEAAWSGISPEQEAQFRERETQITEQLGAAKLASQSLSDQLKAQTEQIKQAALIEKVKQAQIDTEARAEREARLQRQDDSEQMAREQNIVAQAQQARQQQDRHAHDMRLADEEARTQALMGTIKAAVMAGQEEREQMQLAQDVAQSAQSAAQQADLNERQTRVVERKAEVDMQAKKKQASKPKPRKGT